VTANRQEKSTACVLLVGYVFVSAWLSVFAPFCERLFEYRLQAYPKIEQKANTQIAARFT